MVPGEVTAEFAFDDPLMRMEVHQVAHKTGFHARVNS